MRGALSSVAFLLALATGACASNDTSPATAETDPQACSTCHMSEFTAVKNPPHLGQKPTTCGTCHSQADWHPSVLTHSWPLNGAHAKKDACFECHKGDPTVYQGTPKACFGCHAADFQHGPNHVAGHFPETCEECHSTTAWKPRLPNAKAAPTTKSPPKEIETAATAATGGATTTPKAKVARPKPSPSTTGLPKGVGPPDVTSGASHHGY